MKSSTRLKFWLVLPKVGRPAQFYSCLQFNFGLQITFSHNSFVYDLTMILLISLTQNSTESEDRIQK